MLQAVNFTGYRLIWRTLVPGAWTIPMDPVQGPPHVPGAWTIPMDPVPGTPHGVGPWTTPRLILDVHIHAHIIKRLHLCLFTEYFLCLFFLVL